MNPAVPAFAMNAVSIRSLSNLLTEVSGEVAGNKPSDFSGSCCLKLQSLRARYKL